MAAYMIVNLEIHDPATYEVYKTNVPPLIARHGGEYLVRGGKCEVLEGRWHPRRLVLFRFPNSTAVRSFMDDPDYAPLKALRQSVADTDIVVVEGIS